MADTSKTKSAPSILSQDMHVVGKIFSTGDIQIEGRLDGDLCSHAVTVGVHAVVNGEVAGDTVTVFGKVNGTVRGRQVYLCATCHVDGDVFNESLAIESGAQLNGAVKNEKDPLKNAAINPTPQDSVGTSAASSSELD
ncbi:MAG: polymer-forming cytoskeletal protein [Rhodobiaceae bacterium]|jgi:cytoskeletal protein CcmA (bactofilin family)|nr:polymer-forming cytoskeletal protein [Rhodobiaceae bacterium]